MVGITNVTLLISATKRWPFTQVEHGFTPRPTVNSRDRSIFKGTLAGYFLEFRLRRDWVKFAAIRVAFLGGKAVRMVEEEATVPV